VKNAPTPKSGLIGSNRKPPPDDPEQSKRFIKAARELGTDETGEAFERVFKKVALPKNGKPKPPKRHP
jgi:hypothetical protein